MSQSDRGRLVFDFHSAICGNFNENFQTYEVEQRDCQKITSFRPLLSSLPYFLAVLDDNWSIFGL